MHLRKEGRPVGVMTGDRQLHLCDVDFVVVSVVVSCCLFADYLLYWLLEYFV
jgi:hypothetical protein